VTTRCESERAAPDAPPRLPCVLVVDDEAMVRTLLEVALRRAGLEVLSAEGGSSAVRLFEEHRGRIGCVLLDVRMPGLDGPQTLRALRRLDPDVVFCFMTGYPGEHTVAELLALGPARLFDKPFPIDEVVRAVRELTDAA